MEEGKAIRIAIAKAKEWGVQPFGSKLGSAANALCISNRRHEK
jgi:hypothetical protein